MAAWRKYGRIGRHRERLLGRMLAKGIRREFAERVFEQIRGFGEYGFPESHAASFALIAYATAWLKRHYPAEFTCALLNAQPMGFYSPATIVEDAKHHGIEVRPVDIACSEQGCTLEPLGPDSGGTQGDKEPAFAVRMGLGYLKGLSRETCLRIESERRISPFSSIGDLGRRARLDEKALKLLAESGALEAIEAARRRALWEALGVARGGSGHLPGPNPPPLAPLNMLEAITWDYRSSRHSTRGHPLSAWRTELKARGLPDARTVAAMADARRCSYVGMVICRQRPVTASGVMFMTLEDESGFVNVVVWPKVAERYALVAKTASMLEVRGYIQARDGMSYLIADSLWRPRLAEEAAASESRDFR
jgi:error-prone DNA polymerase